MTPIAPLIEAFLDETLARQRGVSRHTRDHRPPRCHQTYAGWLCSARCRQWWVLSAGSSDLGRGG